MVETYFGIKDVIKKCPFCGGEAEIKVRQSFNYKAYIRCKKCRIFLPEYEHRNRDKAIELAVQTWNKRHAGVDDAISVEWLTQQEYGDDEELSIAANTVIKAWLTRSEESECNDEP